MHFYFKPVVWNTQGYLKPSGAKFTSGYPLENGYGHEEWNNSPKFAFTKDRDRFRVFHTEPLNDDVDDLAGQIAIMMIASHAGAQYLVGVAGGCVSLSQEHHRAERLRLIKRLKLDTDAMAEEAWALPSVRKAFDQDKKAFLTQWRENGHWLPNWVAPSDLYLALRQPLKLNPPLLTGRKRLIGMYSSYQSVDQDVFLKVLETVPSSEDQGAVARLRAFGGGDQANIDFDIEGVSHEPPTMRAALIQARLGQGGFRTDLLAKWENSCAVTNCSIDEILRASHIKPWKSSNNHERLDPNNGLMLAAHLDALFDRGLISFADDGAMLVSSEIDEFGNSVWGLGQPLRHAPSPKMVQFLKFHRDQLYRQ